MALLRKSKSSDVYAAIYHLQLELCQRRLDPELRFLDTLFAKSLIEMALFCVRSGPPAL